MSDILPEVQVTTWRCQHCPRQFASAAAVRAHQQFCQDRPTNKRRAAQKSSPKRAPKELSESSPESSVQNGMSFKLEPKAQKSAELYISTSSNKRATQSETEKTKLDDDPAMTDQDLPALGTRADIAKLFARHRHCLNSFQQATVRMWLKGSPLTEKQWPGVWSGIAELEAAEAAAVIEEADAVTALLKQQEKTERDEASRPGQERAMLRAILDEERNCDEPDMARVAALQAQLAAMCAPPNVSDVPDAPVDEIDDPYMRPLPRLKLRRSGHHER
jgi:hypothetical protein